MGWWSAGGKLCKDATVCTAAEHVPGILFSDWLAWAALGLQSSRRVAFFCTKKPFANVPASWAEEADSEGVVRW